MRMQAFMQWLTQHLADSLYAGGPHARKHLSMVLLSSIFETFESAIWVANPVTNPTAHSTTSSSVASDALAATRAVQKVSLGQHEGVLKAEVHLLQQMQRAAESPLGRFDLFAATLAAPAFVQVRLWRSTCACVSAYIQSIDSSRIMPGLGVLWFRLAEEGSAGK